MFLLGAYFSLRKRPLKYDYRSWPFHTVRKVFAFYMSVCVDAIAAKTKEKMEREEIPADLFTVGRRSHFILFYSFLTNYINVINLALFRLRIELRINSFQAFNIFFIDTKDLYSIESGPILYNAKKSLAKKCKTMTT